jgi:hypothetical protein
LILLRPLSSLRTAGSPFNNHFDDLIGKLDVLRGLAQTHQFLAANDKTNQ